MREKDHYELEFVRYLLNTHNDNICCLASVSCKYSNVIRDLYYCWPSYRSIWGKG